MEPFKIFMSYARHDDSIPPDLPKAKGFVTFLDEQLAYELRSLGEPVPQIWRDTRFIERGNQFDPLIQEGIESSGILVVVLSRNWLHRPYCLAELERFEQCWRARGETPARIFKRIVLVSKHSIDPSTLMPLLQGQQGYEFFAGEAGREHEFFARGEICDPAYRDRVRELASYLWRTAADLTTKPGQQIPSPKSKVKPIAVATPASGRTIYVAKPAKDMRQSYFRLLEELQGRGHIVVPGTAEEIPTDATAGKFVRTALESAELSIHLLGEGAGYQPEQGEPIVKLQLSRAAVRASTAADSDGAPGNRFHRIIWAPKAMEVERVQEDGSVHAQMLTERDPLKVLAGFNQQLATDEIVGDNLSKFVEFLVQGLDRIAPTETLTDSPGDGARQIYVYHRPEDTQYAFSLAKALQQRKTEPLLPALEGDAGERNALHRQYLRECDAVVLCWADASEVWAKATARELRDWESLGRDKKFSCRGLVAGPPRRESKSLFLQLAPPSEIDVALDLTEQAEPKPESLDRIIDGQKNPQAS
jgi:hypothetical protein